MKKKVLVVGDLHGRYELATKAFDTYLKEGYDKIIFIGDYTDSFDRSDSDIIRTINICLGMKKTYPDSVELLIGNHDEQYFVHDVGIGIKCSGFRPSLHRALSHILIANQQYFSYACGIGNHLFTHAGVSQSWFGKHFNLLDMWAQRMDIDLTELDSLWIVLDNLKMTADKEILREIGPIRGGFEGSFGGPLWCDKSEMIEGGPLPGLHQVIGHTSQHFISRVHTFCKNEQYENTSVTFVDCLSYRQQFLSLIIDE